MSTPPSRQTLDFSSCHKKIRLTDILSATAKWSTLGANQHTALPKIMAVLNTTPDSFSDGGLLYQHQRLNLSRVLDRVDILVSEGADMIDVGGESTRPGAAPVSLQEEMDRVVPVVEAITQRFDVGVSVDTSTPEVMVSAATAGASMINDVRALQRKGAIEAASASELPICLMHMAGEPTTMQQNPQYDEVVKEVTQFLLERAAVCEKAGIDRDNLLLDPGFGFGKTLDHNLQLFRGITELTELGFPVLVGVSRKSMIGAITGQSTEQRMVGSVAMAMLAARKGAAVLRVHDVAATADALNVSSAVDGDFNNI